MPTKKNPLNDDFSNLLDQHTEFTQIPLPGTEVTGTVISASKHEVRLDLSGIAVGIIRGQQLYNEAPEYRDLKPGDEVTATVVDSENENGEVELSFRFAGQKKTWETLRETRDKKEIVSVVVLDANKGGLLVSVGHVKGFLPVSQLTPEHYPRVPGGDKAKIMEHLKNFIGKTFETKIIDVDEREEKLIVSEKEAWEEMQHNIISKYKVGDAVAGKISAITDFGVFMEFGDGLEGLIHISEIAWQRVENPKDVLKIGDEVTAEIINLQGSKIFLSMKKLKADPWMNVGARYKVGDVVSGKILKINPFGLFVELDPEIHGLAHISELSAKPVSNIEEVAKPGDTKDFKIISLEPKEHRLGLSLKALQKKEKKEDATETSATSEEEKPKKKKTKKEKPEDENTEEKETSETPSEE